jgi:hypothetical protein
LSVLALAVPLSIAGCGGRPATSVAPAAPRLLMSIPAASGRVSAFPEPGSATASPATQISFDGATSNQLADVTVTGSISGRHPGRLADYSTGDGASFLPSRPFVPTERVTVSTGLAIRGGRDGSFSFTVATPAVETTPPAPPKTRPAPTSTPAVTHTVSAHSIRAPVVTVETDATTAAKGDIFLGTKGGGLPHALTIIDPRGNLVWYHPQRSRDVEDVNVQRYEGQRVLTWWQGRQNVPHGYGDGVDEILDSSYHLVATVHAGNGWSADLHDFELTAGGAALITVAAPIRWNLSAVGGPTDGIVINDLIQEIDIKTGLVMFEWSALDHVPLRSSTVGIVHNDTTAWDFIHLNSVAPAPDGRLLLSSRHTFGLYDVDLLTGNLRWTLGGSASDFTLSKRARFYYQHDARFLGPRHITLFDDGGGPPRRETQSRALELTLHLASRTVTVTRSLPHEPAPVVSDSQGDVQHLSNGDLFVGFGAESHITEYDPAGRVVFEATLPRGVSSYRAYRSRWVGRPTSAPSIAVVRGSHRATAHVSWNGDTRTARWRLLVGSSRTDLAASSVEVARDGFETELRIPPGAAYLAVQALSARGRLLATTVTVATH